MRGRRAILGLLTFAVAGLVALVAQSCPPRLANAAYSDTFPVKTGDMYAWASDGDSWDTAHDATSGTVVDADFVETMVANNWAGSSAWQINRAFEVYDTAGIPDNAYILSCILYIYITDIQDDTGVREQTYVVHSSGSYPEDPPVAGDFDVAHYTMSYGGTTGYYDELSDDAWAGITFNSTGKGWINKTGVTRLAFMNSYDYVDSSPGDGEKGYISWCSHSGSNPSYLEINWLVSPTVTSSAATSVGTTTATANGNITDLGGDGSATYRGAVYDTSSHADPGNVAPGSSGYASFTVEGPGSYGTGAFTASLTSLGEDQTYYYRTWCIAGWGYDYSDTEQNFHTLQLPTITTSAATDLMNTTARLPGNVTDAGYPTSDTVVVYWGDNDGGTTPGNWDYSSAPTSPAQPQGVAAFYKDVTGLSPGGTYFFSASAANTTGTSWGTTKTFATTNIAPTVTSSAATSITDVAATLNGNISSVGGDASCDDYGFVWDTTSHSDPGNTVPSATLYAVTGSYWQAAGSHGVGAISHVAVVLPRTTYFFRACAHNSAGWVYSGVEQTFTTHDQPDVTTLDPTGTDLTYTYLRMVCTSLWGSPSTSWGFDYATDAYYTTHGNTYDQQRVYATPITEGVTNSALIVLLTPGTKYHFRGWVVNAYGTGYGSDVHFGTIPEDPTGLAVVDMTYTTVSFTWTGAAHAQQYMMRYETSGTTNDFPAGPTSGTEAYFNTATSCTVTSLTAGETYFFGLWSWIEGSDVYSTGYTTVSVTLLVPEPENLQADAIDATHIHLWWLVPDGFVSDNSMSTVVYTHVGDYPADPPAPPGAGDIEVYNELTGDAGVSDFTWDNATAGTPYFFYLWFYNSVGDNYTTPVSAICTTPAGFDDTGIPGDDAFTDPTDANMHNMPGNEALDSVSDIWGFGHGFMWCFVAIFVAILFTTGAILATKSGLVGTGAGALILVIANTQQVCPPWVTIVFIFLGLVLSWAASHVYST